MKIVIQAKKKRKKSTLKEIRFYNNGILLYHNTVYILKLHVMPYINTKLSFTTNCIHKYKCIHLSSIVRSNASNVCFSSSNATKHLKQHADMEAS